MKVLINLDSLERLRFFFRLGGALNKLGVTCVYVTALPSLVLRGLAKGQRVHLIRLVTSRETNAPSSFFEVATGELDYESAVSAYASAQMKTRQLVLSSGIDGCLVWNGERAVDRAVQDVALSFGLKIVFLELSNLPGKLFADHCGVNAKSSVAKNAEVLDAYQDPGEDYVQWLTAYIGRKEKQVTIPQARTGTKPSLGALMNKSACKIGLTPNTKAYNFRDYLQIVAGSLASPHNYDQVGDVAAYVLYPMQVTADTQLIIHAGMSNTDGIRVAKQYASEMGLPLVVKTHPAETDPRELKRILALQKELEFYVVNEPIYPLILRATLVVTINSTVGFEAMLLGRKVEVLAPAYYKGLSPKRVEKLIMSYFVDIDYFGEAPIPLHVARTLLGRMYPAGSGAAGE